MVTFAWHQPTRVVPDLTISNPAGAGQIRQEPDLARFRNSNQIQPDLDLGSSFGSQNNTPDESTGVNNAVSCSKEAVQFSVSFVTSLFASFLDEICVDFVSLSSE